MRHRPDLTPEDALQAIGATRGGGGRHRGSGYLPIVAWWGPAAATAARGTDAPQAIGAVR